MDGQTLFPSAGATLQAFLPEGCHAGDDDERGVVRSPDSVRTLGLRNIDMKVISATLNVAFWPIVQQTTSRTQRGFIAGRQFTSNILELDVMARTASLHPRARDQQPIPVALDFGQAFPSLSQQYLFT
eukprot:7845039-Pyramimonas_sp.AAC.1